MVVAVLLQGRGRPGSAADLGSARGGAGRWLYTARRWGQRLELLVLPLSPALAADVAGGARVMLGKDLRGSSCAGSAGEGGGGYCWPGVRALGLVLLDLAWRVHTAVVLGEEVLGCCHYCCGEVHGCWCWWGFAPWREGRVKGVCGNRRGGARPGIGDWRDKVVNEVVRI